MKRLFIAIAILAFLMPATSRADEGMWIPMLIEKNIVDMQKMGLKLSAEDIYSINQSSLKDAIVIFGGGCTGEIISPEGLLLTNHHCGYGSIQKVSTEADNYLRDGFWASSKAEEIPIEGLRVRFMVRMEDVTAKVMNGITDDLDDKTRNETMRDNVKGIVDQATKDTEYNAIVESFYGGNEYYLIVYETFTDIRLVGTPPESIGKFGADTDNWMWPRHTGDFSLFRVYSDPDGNPAKYDENNIPLKPKHFLPVSIAGVEKGDFAMIMGYPGSTQRYLSSFGVDMAVNESNMTIVKIREEKLRIMKEGMDADPGVRLQYASKYARTSNYWKYFIGQTKGLKKLKVADRKRQEEADFTAWIDEKPERKEKYGDALPMISEAYETLKEYNLQNWYLREAVLRGAEILMYANRFNKLKTLLENKETDPGDIQKQVEALRSGIENHFKDYNQEIDRNMLASMMQMFHQNVPLDQQPVYLLETSDKYKDDFNAMAEDIFEKSIFARPGDVNEFLDNPKAKTLSKDPALTLVRAFVENYQEMRENIKEAQKMLNDGEKRYIAGIRKMHPDKNFYPDANFTMRLTYGNVNGYFPSDAVYYEYYTTMDGIMEKEDPNNPEFIVPEKLKALYKEKDFGQYGMGDQMPVCFLTNHDITGGNSGSPVLNGKGELIGLAFDGNWEAMSGDIAFEPELQRTINVDIRYVLFIIDKFAGADNLIREMTIVREKPKKEKMAAEVPAMEQASAE